MLWACFLLGVYCYLESQFIKVRCDDVAVTGLPPSLDGFKIIHLSDLHSSGFGRLEERLCRILREMKADLVVFTGDYKHRKKTKRKGVAEALKQISRCIRSRTGVFGVLGNKDDPGIVEVAENAGIEIVSGKARRLTVGNDEMWIAGIDSLPLGRATRALLSVTEKIPEGSFKILLSHGPDVMPLARALGYSLILCGDTHGGQIRLPFVGAPFVKSRISRRYCRGLIAEGGSLLCVHSGIGTCGFPLRLLCPPEVRVLTLRTKGNTAEKKETEKATKEQGDERC